MSSASRVSDEEAEVFGGSVKDWPAFPDSAEALAYLKQHYKLVILSNVDRASFAHSNAKLGVEFDAVYTARISAPTSPIRAISPICSTIWQKSAWSKDDILHTAQSLTHDHVPAEDVGLTTCWIDRRHDQPGFGATKQPPRQPRIDVRFTSLGEMAEAHRAELAG